ncbi:hypothetical protein LIC_10229 [Leptospira interrogans serovar Copenhageni str. Fiocruz L1-130]|uniref:Uncharacterized protein n=1 Tax=Leptospira interrogans serogroup Icterohaemorrhagiae serovar copenhageni (strain Fiocruz L1-130) TaxID=267671 RepID=Q72VR7_LEPIC|nr:hypothetical protein LIC_10229 [Leptospira interrogans serovar Copenhageni str. Fiocruz L1-130]
MIYFRFYFLYLGVNLTRNSFDRVKSVFNVFSEIFGDLGLILSSFRCKFFKFFFNFQKNAVCLLSKCFAAPIAKLSASLISFSISFFLCFLH